MEHRCADYINRFYIDTEQRFGPLAKPLLQCAVRIKVRRNRYYIKRSLYHLPLVYLAKPGYHSLVEALRASYNLGGDDGPFAVDGFFDVVNRNIEWISKNIPPVDLDMAYNEGGINPVWLDTPRFDTFSYCEHFIKVSISGDLTKIVTSQPELMYDMVRTLMQMVPDSIKGTICMKGGNVYNLLLNTGELSDWDFSVSVPTPAAVEACRGRDPTPVAIAEYRKMLDHREAIYTVISDVLHHTKQQLPEIDFSMYHTDIGVVHARPCANITIDEDQDDTVESISNNGVTENTTHVVTTSAPNCRGYRITYNKSISNYTVYEKRVMYNKFDLMRLVIPFTLVLDSGYSINVHSEVFDFGFTHPLTHAWSYDARVGDHDTTEIAIGGVGVHSYNLEYFLKDLLMICAFGGENIKFKKRIRRIKHIVRSLPPESLERVFATPTNRDSFATYRDLYTRITNMRAWTGGAPDGSVVYIIIIVMMVIAILYVVITHIVDFACYIVWPPPAV